MRTKLTALLVAGAALVAGAVAQAAPIPVASYQFQSQDDVTAFQKVGGTACTRKWVGNQALGIGVGRNTDSCTYRSSVVGDSSAGVLRSGDGGDHHRWRRDEKLQKKSFVGVGVRWSSSAGYILRILPNAHKWQYFRDPKGAAGPKLGSRREAASSSRWEAAQHGRDSGLLVRRRVDQRDRFGQRHGRGLGHGLGGDQPDGRQTVVTAGARDREPGPGSPAFSTTSSSRFRTPSSRRRRDSGRPLRANYGEAGANSRWLQANPLPSAGWPRPRLSVPNPPVRRRGWAGIGW